MSVLYVKEQGTCVRKKDQCIVVSKGRDTLLQIPADNVDNIAVI